MGGPLAMVDFVSNHTNPNNLEKITHEPDMNVRHSIFTLEFSIERAYRI